MKLRRRPQKIPPPAPDRLPAVIESLLFVAEEPQQIDTLSRSLSVPRQRVEQAVEQLAASTNGRGIFVQRQGDRVQLATVPDAAPYIEHFLEVEHGQLSRAALETLAIIAYRQPVTRGDIEDIPLGASPSLQLKQKPLRCIRPFELFNMKINKGILLGKGFAQRSKGLRI